MVNYIAEETVYWLAGNDNPAVRYLAIREFPSLFASSTPLAAYAALCESPRIAAIVSSAKENIAGDPVRYDLWYRGSVWAFAELVYCGLTVSNPVVAGTAEYLIRTVQLPSGGFTMNWAPPQESAGWSGDILYYLSTALYEGSGIHRAARWLMDNQRPDGGWFFSPVRSITDALLLSLFRHVRKPADDDFTAQSPLIPTIACARGLLAYHQRFGGAAKAIDRAAEFILGKGLLGQKSHTGGDLLCTNRHFHSLGTPILFRHDILSALQFLSGAGKLGDERASVPFNLIMRKRQPDGGYRCENRAHGTLHEKYRLRKENHDKWVTLRALQLLKDIQDQ